VAGLFMKEVSLTLVVGAGVPAEFNCNVSQAMVEAEPGDVVTYATLGGPSCTQSRSADPKYTLHLVGMQDWDGSAGSIGLARFLEDNAGELATFVFQAHGVGVDPSDVAPAKTGTCQLLPPLYGGEVDKWAEFDVALPISGRPELVTSAAALDAFLAGVSAPAPAEAEPAEAAA
jgi:hypothetical protein